MEEAKVDGIPMHKKVEAAFKVLPPSQDPVEWIEVAFKRKMVDFLLYMMEEHSVAENRIHIDQYKQAARVTINEFLKAEDIPDRAKFSRQKYEQWRDEVMKGIAQQAKDNEGGKDYASVRSALDLDVVQHNELQKTEGGIIIPHGVVT